MFCQNCGMEVASTYKMCPKCGGRSFSNSLSQSAAGTVPPITTNYSASKTSASPDGLLNAFRAIVIADTVLVFFSMFLLSNNEEYMVFFNMLAAIAQINPKVLIVLSVLPYGLVLLVVNIGIYRLRNWARIVFTINIVLLLLITFGVGLISTDATQATEGTLNNGFLDVVGLLEWMTSGALAILAWFSPLRTQFRSGSTR